MLTKMWRQRNSKTLLMGLQISTTMMEKNMDISQKIIMELPYDPAVPLLNRDPKDVNDHIKEIAVCQCLRLHYFTTA